MVNRQVERSCSFGLSGFGVVGEGLVRGFAVVLIGLGTLLAPQTMAGEWLGDGLVGEESTLVDPAAGKALPLNNHALDGTGLALFPKSRAVAAGSGLDQETRCSWWLPRELPLGGGFTHALFCGGSVVGGSGPYSAPLLSDS